MHTDSIEPESRHGNQPQVSPPPSAGIMSAMPQQPAAECCREQTGEPLRQSSLLGDNRNRHFIQGEVPSPAGPVLRLKTRLDARDHWGAFKVRSGFGRNRYAVAPGLYAVGGPSRRSPVLVTANYKLSLDALRRELTGQDAWVLVLDTRGVNVWCAAGKGTFGTDELIHRVKANGLEKMVSHRRLVLPQLGASGVAGHEVRRQTGFRVVWGPVRARDLPDFLARHQAAPADMRRITFNLRERATLIPVEIAAAFKPAVGGIGSVMLIALLLGIAGPAPIKTVWQTMLLGGAAVGIGLFSGAVGTPILLPWLPGKAFALKGAGLGLAAAVISQLVLYPAMDPETGVALTLLTIAASSFLAMNFTGATPFTSPSGVEKEMRWAIPAQALVITIGMIGWFKAIWIG